MEVGQSLPNRNEKHTEFGSTDMTTSARARIESLETRNATDAMEAWTGKNIEELAKRHKKGT